MMGLNTTRQRTPHHLILLFACVFLSFCLGLVNGIYEDEAGRIDWTIEAVGKVHSLSFADSTDTKRVYVGTESNVIGALNYLTGNIAWRQLLPKEHQLDNLFHKGKRILSVSNGGEYIALWRATDGAAIWDAKSESISSCTGKNLDAALLNSDIDGDGIFDVILLVDGTVQLRSGGSGEIISSVFSDCFASSLMIVEDPQQRPRIFTLGIDQSNGGLAVKSITIEGKVAHKHTYQSDSKSEIVSFITVGDRLVALDKSNTLHTLSFKSISLSSSTSFSTHTLSSKISSASKIDSRFVKLEQARTSSSFLVRLNEHETALLSLDGSAIKLLHTFNHNEDRICAASGAGSKEAFAVVHVGKTTDIEVFVVSQRSSEKLSIPQLNHSSNGDALYAFLEIVPKASDGVVNLVAIVTEDHALTLIRDNSLVWTREEGLASLVHTEIIDPPGDIAEQALLEKEFHEIDHLSVAQQFLQQVHGQVIGLISSVPRDASSLIEWINTRLHQSDESETSLTKDRFGLKKLLISYSSEAGSVFGIHSVKGSLVWKRFFSQTQKIKGLHFLRSSAHYPPEAVLILSSEDSTTLVWINVLTGDTLKTSKINAKHAQSLVLPYYVDDEKVLLLIDTEQKAHIVPESREARQVFRVHSDKTFFFQITSSSIDGFGFDSDLQPQKRWSFAIPDGSSSFYALRNKHEIVQSPVKNLGADGVTAKYINKNTMACAIVSSASSTSLETSVLDIYILDTVTGDVVYHTFHRGARGPVNMVVSENWLVYHFFNQKANRYQMSVVELYEKELNWDDTVFSSFSHVRPVAYSQTFFFNSDISAIGVTVTARGITSKQILLATEAGQIIGIDRNLIDARRVTAERMSAVDKEEGMIPYDANIVPGPKHYHSYNRTVYNVKKLEVGWARLESTGIVIAIGGPTIFFSRVLPSDSFDLLPPTFNFGMLIFTCVVLVILTLISSWFSKSKDLNQQWK